MTATHGHCVGGTYTKVYRTWSGMMNRCYDKGSPKYKNWGGRGIKVCKRWHKFENFFADMGHAPSPNHSLDRHPNYNGNYRPSNCRWATSKEQRSNSRQNVFLKFNGETKTVTEWCEIKGLSRSTVYNRLYKGMSVKEILSSPPRKRKGSKWQEKFKR